MFGDCARLGLPEGLHKEGCDDIIKALPTTNCAVYDLNDISDHDHVVPTLALEALGDD